MSQYFDNEKLPSNIVKYETKIFGITYTFLTDNGVFSKEKLDYGTRLLIESLPLSEVKGKILDVGCGYGVISIVLSKMLDVEADGIDVNKRALHLAQRNAKENKCSNINFFESNIYENVLDKYDVIITNPPIRAGKKIVYAIVMDAKEHLNENGTLFIVVRKDQGAKTMIRDLEELYSTEVINKNKGFLVIRCKLR